MSKSRQYAIQIDAEPAMNRNADDQLRKFQDLARELEADESEERFEDQVRRIAKAKEPPAGPQDGD
jgi:hypothetical protein